MPSLLDTDERALQTAVREYLTAKVAPLVAHHERERTFPWECLAELYEFGYVRGVVSASSGGYAQSAMMQAILMEEAGRCWGSLRTTVNVQSMVARVLAAAATAEQQDRFLAPLLAGERFGWFALTEAEAGSDAAALRTTARAVGSWWTTGRRSWSPSTARPSPRRPTSGRLRCWTGWPPRSPGPSPRSPR